VRKTHGALVLLVWGATLILTGVATGNPEPTAKYGATGSTQLVFGLAFGTALVIIGGWTLLAGRRHRDS
jgi:hypothetical protein